MQLFATELYIQIHAMTQKSIALAAAIAVLLPLPTALSAQALSAAYDFTVEVTDGPLAGQQFGGSFCYDNADIQGQGLEVLREADGFNVSMAFYETVTAADDSDYPDFPTLTLEDGEVKQLDFWVEEGDRLVWWDLPHWQVSLSPSDDMTECAIAPTDAPINESTIE